MSARKVELYARLAELMLARENCQKSENHEWLQKHGQAIRDLCREHLPHGSGFDSGVTLNQDESTSERLVFNVAFHPMNDAGFYVDWRDYKAIVTPSLVFGFSLDLKGRDYNQLKEYIG